MALHKLTPLLSAALVAFDHEGRLKGPEHVITGIQPAGHGLGPRYFLQGYGTRAFLRMNANSYLGLHEEIRFQLSAAHTQQDIAYVLDAL
jgi:glycine C-acetyltransferase